MPGPSTSPVARLHRGDAAASDRSARSRQRQPARQKFLARLQGEITKRGVIDVLRNGIKHGPARRGPLLRHAIAGQSKAAERFAPIASASRASSATAATRRARARPRALHQRPADRHLRAEEQPDQADRRGRGRAVQARPRPARAAVPVRPLRGALRGGRPRSALLHPPQGQGVVVPAVQPRME